MLNTAENKAVVRRSVEEGWNKGDLAVLQACYAADYRHHDANAPEVSTFAEALQFLSPAGEALGAQTSIEELIGEGDLVAKRWTIRGTHRGELFGAPPTGKPVAYGGVTIYRLVGGKIVEGWWHYDMLDLMRQLGALPAHREVVTSAR